MSIMPVPVLVHDYKLSITFTALTFFSEPS